MTESTEPMPEPLSEAAAEDIAEQHTPVTPDEPERHRRAENRPEANEADAWEQEQDVPLDDDEQGPGYR